MAPPVSSTSKRLELGGADKNGRAGIPARPFLSAPPSSNLLEVDETGGAMKSKFFHCFHLSRSPRQSGVQKRTSLNASPALLSGVFQGRLRSASQTVLCRAEEACPARSNRSTLLRQQEGVQKIYRRQKTALRSEYALAGTPLRADTGSPTGRCQDFVP